MKVNLKKLTKLQEEFKEGNLLQNITAWDILDFSGREGGTISLHSLIKDMEEGDIYLKELHEQWLEDKIDTGFEVITEEDQ